MKQISFTIILVASVLLCLSAHGQESQPGIGAQNTMSEKSADLKANNSWHNRIGKRYIFTARTDFKNENDLGLYGTDDNSIYFGRYLRANDIIALEIITGGYNHERHAFNYTQSKVRDISALVTYRQFTGNSFYWKAGFGYSSYEAFWLFAYANSVNVRNESGYQFTASSLIGALNIGNEWQWERFTIGCDWVGIKWRLASQFENEKLYGIRKELDVHNLAAAKDGFNGQVDLTVLKVNVGASW